MLLIVVQTEQIQNSEIIYKDIFPNGASSKLFQWQPLQDIVNIYKPQNWNPSKCLSSKVLLQIESIVLLNF